MRVLLIALTFSWLGLVVGISFMEAPLKFTAPNITLVLGLGIGKVVFGVLNKVELVIALLISLSIFKVKPPHLIKSLYAIIIGTLLLQSLWLLPVLDERIDIYLSGSVPPASSLHVVYIIAEIIKLGVLLIVGIKFLNSELKPPFWDNRA